MTIVYSGEGARPNNSHSSPTSLTFGFRSKSHIPLVLVLRGGRATAQPTEAPAQGFRLRAQGFLDFKRESRRLSTTCKLFGFITSGFRVYVFVELPTGCVLLNSFFWTPLPLCSPHGSRNPCWQRFPSKGEARNIADDLDTKFLRESQKGLALSP